MSSYLLSSLVSEQALPKHTIAAVGHIISFCRDHDPVAVTTLQTDTSQELVKPDRTELSMEARSEVAGAGKWSSPKAVALW